MKKILLYHPKTFHELNYKYFWIPYSVLSIAAYLCNEGYDVKIVDNNTDISEEIEEIKSYIRESKVIGISCFIGKQIIDGLEFAEYAKKINNNIKFVWGGYAPTLLPELFLENKYVDYLIKGPNELEFCNIVNKIYSFEMKYKENNHNCFNIKKRPNYPFELLKIEQYIHDDPEISDRTINYVTSQGCPFECGFCSDVSFYHSKQYSVCRERIISDIKYLVSKYNVNGIKLYDSNFFASKKRVFEFINDLNRNRINIQWAASAHPNNLINYTEDEWELIEKSGCSRILIGAESGCQEVLDMIKKHTTLEKIDYVAKKLAEHHIIGSFTFIVGFPGEPKENVNMTIDFANKLLSYYSEHEAKIHFYLPYPGTPMYEKAKVYGFTPPSNLKEWAYYDYYKNEMPWVSSCLFDLVNKFNLDNCPYVSDS